MMTRIGNFLFRFRNRLFPLLYLLLLAGGPVLFDDLHVAVAAGLIVALAGQALRAVTIGLDYIVRGGRKNQVYADRLVQGGLFAHCRNPLYVGNLVIILGLGIASNSVIFLCTGVPLFVFAYCAIIAAEENFLRNKFGGEFDDYCRRVNRFLPRLAGLRSTFTDVSFNWRRVISAEYGATFAWVAAMILVTARNLRVLGGCGWNSARMHALMWMLLAAFVAYLVARILKKTGRFKVAPAAG